MQVKSSVYDFLIVGHTISVKNDKHPLQKILGNAIRAVGISKALRVEGYKVALIVDFSSHVTSESLICDGINLFDRTQLNNLIDISETVLISTTKPSVIEREHGVVLDKLKNKNTVLISCFTDVGQTEKLHRLYDSFKFITVNNNEQKSILEKLKLSGEVMKLDFGINPISIDSGYDTQTVSALWVGCIRSKEVLKKIIRYAECNTDVKVSVVSRLVFDRDSVTVLPGNKISGAQVNLLEDKISPEEIASALADWIQCEMPSNIQFLGSAELTYSQILSSHDIGLDFCESVFQNHDNTKILDYMSAGLFVVSEVFAPSNRYIAEFDCGYVLQSFNSAELSRSLECFKSFKASADRNQIASRVQESYSWRSQTRKILNFIKQS